MLLRVLKGKPPPLRSNMGRNPCSRVQEEILTLRLRCIYDANNHTGSQNHFNLSTDVSTLIYIACFFVTVKPYPVLGSYGRLICIFITLASLLDKVNIIIIINFVINIILHIKDLYGGQFVVLQTREKRQRPRTESKIDFTFSRSAKLDTDRHVSLLLLYYIPSTAHLVD